MIPLNESSQPSGALPLYTPCECVIYLADPLKAFEGHLHMCVCIPACLYLPPLYLTICPPLPFPIRSTHLHQFDLVLS